MEYTSWQINSQRNRKSAKLNKRVRARDEKDRETESERERAWKQMMQAHLISWQSVKNCCSAQSTRFRWKTVSIWVGRQAIKTKREISSFWSSFVWFFLLFSEPIKIAIYKKMIALHPNRPKNENEIRREREREDVSSTSLTSVQKLLRVTKHTPTFNYFPHLFLPLLPFDGRFHDRCLVAMLALTAIDRFHCSFVTFDFWFFIFFFVCRASSVLGSIRVFFVCFFIHSFVRSLTFAL